MSEVVIVGGGVVGLTVAYELASLDVSVTLIERQDVGREASWAGAGMLPPGLLQAPSALQALTRLSHHRWPELTQQLLDETGIDNGFRRCGAIQLAPETPEQLAADCTHWEQQNIPVQLLSPDQLRKLEPAVATDLCGGYFLPTAGQVRNPWHLKALQAACRQRGVTMITGQTVHKFDVAGDRVRAVESAEQRWTADQFVLTSGAWSQPLLDQLGVDFAVEPIRGQILLYHTEPPLLTRILEVGARYLVPRDDGHLLVGSTTENVGFNKETTAAGIAELSQFASQLVPELTTVAPLRTWAGLRPRAIRGWPCIGPAPQQSNVIIATGHYRDGLMQSPGTAQVVRALLLGQPLPLPSDLLATFQAEMTRSNLT